MTEKELLAAERRLSSMGDGIRRKILPAHYESLLSQVHAKATALARDLNLNPRAIEEMGDKDYSYLYPSLYCLVPGMTRWYIFDRNNLGCLSAWVGVPLPEEVPQIDIAPAIQELEKLKRYRPDRILANFPIMSDLFPNVDIPEDHRRSISVIPSNLVAICTMAKTLGVEL